MKETEICDLILGCFREKEIMKGISESDDFFDLGVSSLTVVELQIVVEKAINTKVETASLMGAPTIKEWAALYFESLHRDKLEAANV